MSQESVLGYENNELVFHYRDKFFNKLYQFFCSLDIDPDIKNKFLNQDDSSQKDFLLLPDISTLLIRLQNTGSQSILDIFLQELGYFINGELESLTSNSGEYIEGTTIRFTMGDNNPDSSIVNHPDHDKDGMIGWGDKSPDEWNKVFSDSFKIIKEVNSDFFIELQSMVQKIIPMKTSLDVHNSCTYKECIGTLYLGYTTGTQHPELHIIEALIHESSHNKLNLIMQSEKLLLNDYNLQFYSPYRPDARHIHGVLLGVHALVPAVFVLLQAVEKGKVDDLQWKEKIILYHIKNKLGLNVIKKHMKATKTGTLIVEDIMQVIKKCDTMIQKTGIVNEVNTSEIQNRAKQHFLQVKNSNKYLQY